MWNVAWKDGPTGWVAQNWLRTVEQTSDLAGTVIHQVEGTPISGATVTWGPFSTLTDSNGDFVIPNVACIFDFLQACLQGEQCSLEILVQPDCGGNELPPIQCPSGNCAGLAAPSNAFSPGDTVRVYNTGGLGLRARTPMCGEPSVNKPEGTIGVIQPAATNGECCDGFNRWLILWQDESTPLWSAEGDPITGEMWLENVAGSDEVAIASVYTDPASVVEDEPFDIIVEYCNGTSSSVSNLTIFFLADDVVLGNATDSFLAAGDCDDRDRTHTFTSDGWHEIAGILDVGGNLVDLVIEQVYVAEAGSGGGPPSVVITDPDEGDTITDDPIIVRGIASDPPGGDSGIDYVQIRVNGGTWQTASGTTDWQESTGLDDGQNVIEAQAFDDDGNSSSIDSITITFDDGPTPSPLNVTSGSFVATGPVGGPFDDSIEGWSLSLFSAGPVDWLAAPVPAVSWLSPTSANGTLEPGGWEHVTFALNAQAYQLPPGIYETEIHITDLTFGETFIRDVSLTILPGPDCDTGQVVDCDGNCVPQYLIGNGFCDPQLDCAQFGYDGGDCTSGAICEVKLLASDGQPSDDFGQRIDVDGDLAIVGADNGKVYILRFVDGAWVEETSLTAWDGSDGFEYSAVAIQGDFAFVTAYEGMGSVFVFMYDGSTWQNHQHLVSLDPGQFNLFGRDIAVDGDILGVGEPAAVSGGRVWIFRRYGDTWESEQQISASDAGVSHRFGEFVDVSGNQLIVGRGGGACCGGLFMPSTHAYVYRFNGETWGEEQFLEIPEPPLGEKTKRILVAIHDDVALVHRVGSGAFVYRNDGLNWSFEQTIDSSLSLLSMAVRNDMIVLGNQDDSSAEPDTGAAYVFELEESGWTQNAIVVASDADEGDDFGDAVALNETHILIGADSDDQNGNNAGAVYSLDLACVLTGCGLGQVSACNGKCLPATSIGNNICDAALNCPEFNFDGGDCPNVPGDTTADGLVDVVDLLAVLTAWGTCPPPPAVCPADIEPFPGGNGQVDVLDLLMVLSNWSS